MKIKVDRLAIFDNIYIIMDKIEFTLHGSFYPHNEIRNFVAEVCKRLGYNSKTVYEIKTATDEAFTNVVQHAHKHKEGKIKIKLVSDPKKITISVKDWGEPFKATSLKSRSPHDLVHTKKEGGLGVLLMARLMDRIRYVRRKTHNELIMVKYRKEKTNATKH